MWRPAESVRWIDRAYGALLLIVHVALVPMFLGPDDPYRPLVVVPIVVAIAGILLMLRIALAWIIFSVYAIAFILIAPFVAIVGFFIMVGFDPRHGFMMFASSVGLSVLYVIGFVLAALCFRRENEVDRLHAQSSAR